jgi:hypothetical protein
MGQYLELSPLVVAVLAGSLLRKQGQGRYWMVCCLLTILLTAVLAVHVAASYPPDNSPLFVAVALFGVPVLATFGVTRLARGMRYTAVVAGLGVAVYLLALLLMMTVTVTAGLLTPPELQFEIPGDTV